MSVFRVITAAQAYQLVQCHFIGFSCTKVEAAMRVAVLILFLAAADGSSRVKGRQNVLLASEPFDESTILVSYSYFEKDDTQLANMGFFTAVGMGVASTFKRPPATDFVIVISGDACRPCRALRPHVLQLPASSLPSTLSAAFSGPGLTMLHRTDNVGMDFAAHNVCACPNLTQMTTCPPLTGRPLLRHNAVSTLSRVNYTSTRRPVMPCGGPA